MFLIEVYFYDWNCKFVLVHDRLLVIFCSLFTNRRYVDCWYHAIAIIIVLNQSINSMYIHRDPTFSTIETIFYNIKKKLLQFESMDSDHECGRTFKYSTRQKERESLITYFDHHYGNLPKLTTDFNASRTPFGNRFVLIFLGVPFWLCLQFHL